MPGLAKASPRRDRRLIRRSFSCSGLRDGRFHGEEHHWSASSSTITTLVTSFLKAIESALKRTCEPIETVVVDDGSTDNSMSVAMKKYPLVAKSRYPLVAR